jgi:hypothetical protein
MNKIRYSEALDLHLLNNIDLSLLLFSLSPLLPHLCINNAGQLCLIYLVYRFGILTRFNWFFWRFCFLLSFCSLPWLFRVVPFAGFLFSTFNLLQFVILWVCWFLRECLGQFWSFKCVNFSRSLSTKDSVLLLGFNLIIFTCVKIYDAASWN